MAFFIHEAQFPGLVEGVRHRFPHDEFQGDVVIQFLCNRVIQIDCIAMLSREWLESRVGCALRTGSIRLGDTKCIDDDEDGIGARSAPYAC